MGINLNDDSFDGGSNVKIFNDGKAGSVENVKLSIERKAADAKEGSPNYKLVFTDTTGASCNTALWYVEGGTDYNTEDELVAKQGKILKHVAHAVLGSDFQFPEYPNAKAMLDGVMKLVNEGLKNGGTFRVFANYGSTMSVKKYIQPRSWVPFMEPMSVSADVSRLAPGNIDAMERLQEDSVESPAMASAPASDDDDW
jgi:hypothetical protein